MSPFLFKLTVMRVKNMHTIYYSFLTTLLMMIAYPARAQYNKWNGVAFSASRTISNLMNKPGIIEKSKVYYSQIGTRVEFGEGVAKTVSIVNYKKQKCWFILPDKKIYYEISLDKKTKQCSVVEIVGFKPETRNPGIFFPRPCNGYKKMTAMGKEYVAGRRTSKWNCISQTGSNVLQWYDPSLRMVIREISNNKVTQASEIKLARKVNTSLLQPPSNFSRQD